MAGLTDAQAHKLGHDVVIGEAEAASKHPGTMRCTADEGEASLQPQVRKGAGRVCLLRYDSW